MKKLIRLWIYTGGASGRSHFSRILNPIMSLGVAMSLMILALHFFDLERDYAVVGGMCLFLFFVIRNDFYWKSRSAKSYHPQLKKEFRYIQNSGRRQYYYLGVSAILLPYLFLAVFLSFAGGKQ